MQRDSIIINHTVVYTVCFFVAMTESYFICNSTGQPVPLDYKCDNYQDCSDGSDEAGCGKRSYRVLQRNFMIFITGSTGCSLSEFMCNDGNCIRGSLLCDGVYHCPDDSDEKDCRECVRERELEFQ